MHDSLQRVLNSIASGRPSATWVAARSEVRQMRQLVDDYLANASEQGVYGFTTRLGQEDSQPLTAAGQRELLNGHLIDPWVTLPADWRRVLVATKLEQTSHGESGIHPYAYDCLLDALSLDGSIRGNWLNSYSSGDVVAGAWLARDLHDHYPELLTHSGDLITMINGNFVSTSLALVSSSLLVDGVASLLAVWLPRVSGAAGQAGQSPQGPQLPVSLRDAQPVLDAIHGSLGALGSAINTRLAKPSCNPRFVATERGLEPMSQSSFLDFSLTFAIANSIQLANIAAGVWQRLIQHRCDADGSTLRRIQSPKTAQALVERMRAGASTPSAFSGFDSAGIEDLRDLSLIHARTLLEQCLLLKDFEAIWGGLGELADADSARGLRMELALVMTDSEPDESDGVSVSFDHLAALGRVFP